MTHPVYKATKVLEVQVTYIMDEEGCPLTEIHFGRWTPGKYYVLLRRGLETFVADGFSDAAKEHGTIREAAETVDLFLDCGAAALFSSDAPRPRWAIPNGAHGCQGVPLKVRA